jgi:hypothetical protein
MERICICFDSAKEPPGGKTSQSRWGAIWRKGEGEEMASRDYGDIIGSCMIIAFGLFVAIYAYFNYQLGTIAEMGPGMVPVGVGALLAGTGVLILIPALVRESEVPKPDYRSAGSVVASLAGFALTVNFLGLVPAIFVLTFIAAAGSKGPYKVLRTFLVSAVLSVVVVLIFLVGLGMPFKMFRWPF